MKTGSGNPKSDLTIGITKQLINFNFEQFLFTGKSNEI
jgi:hypothetical protein